VACRPSTWPSRRSDDSNLNSAASQDELEALRAQLAGRDQEIRELREKITAKVNQVAVDGPTGAP